jgi:hypothetical protein
MYQVGDIGIYTSLSGAMYQVKIIAHQPHLIYEWRIQILASPDPNFPVGDEFNVNTGDMRVHFHLVYSAKPQVNTTTLPPVTNYTQNVYFDNNGVVQKYTLLESNTQLVDKHESCEVVENEVMGKKFHYCRDHKVEVIK